MRDRPPRRDLRGLGSWIDIFDDAAWSDPEAAVRAMDRKGATILFLQSASSRPGPPVHRPARTARFLRAAHERGIDVIAWYLAPYVDRAYETRRAIGAIRFETRDGERFDGFALDIETAADSPPAPVRNRRLIKMSERLREFAGPLYPLGAIIPSPAGLAMPHGQRWWPDFPYRELHRLYDAFLPMGYYTYHATTAPGAYRDTRRNIRLLREETGDPQVPDPPDRRRRDVLERGRGTRVRARGEPQGRDRREHVRPDDDGPRGLACRARHPISVQRPSAAPWRIATSRSRIALEV